jgi:hypothetical protein
MSIETKDVVLQTVISLLLSNIYETFEDTKGVIRIRKSKNNRQHNDQRRRTKGQIRV